MNAISTSIESKKIVLDTSFLISYALDEWWPKFFLEKYGITALKFDLTYGVIEDFLRKSQEYIRGGYPIDIKGPHVEFLLKNCKTDVSPEKIEETLKAMENNYSALERELLGQEISLRIPEVGILERIIDLGYEEGFENIGIASGDLKLIDEIKKEGVKFEISPMLLKANAREVSVTFDCLIHQNVYDKLLEDDFKEDKRQRFIAIARDLIDDYGKPLPLNIAFDVFKSKKYNISPPEIEGVDLLPLRAYHDGGRINLDNRINYIHLFSYKNSFEYDPNIPHIIKKVTSKNPLSKSEERGIKSRYLVKKCTIKDITRVRDEIGVTHLKSARIEDWNITKNYDLVPKRINQLRRIISKHPFFS